MKNVEEYNAKHCRSGGIPLRSQLLCFAAFSLLSFIAIVVHSNIFSPAPFRQPEMSAAKCDKSQIFAAVSTNAVSARYNQIASFGSRAPGQPGLELARQHIADSFRANGLEVYGQDVDLAYPLLNPGTGFISNETACVSVWPLSPNGAQTVTTGKSGIDGELFLATPETIRACDDFSGKIAVLDTSKPLYEPFGLSLSKYIDIGFSAVVVTHSGGLDKAKWDGDAAVKMVTKLLPVNIVRVAAEPEILNHIGERVHLDVRSVWRNVRTENVIGVLRCSSGTNRSAIVIPVEYDAMSILPDFAQGSMQALQAAILLQTAEGLSHYRGEISRDVVFVAATGIGSQQAGLSRLISTIGENGRRQYAAESISAKMEDNDAVLRSLGKIRSLFGDSRFAVAGCSRETRIAETSLPHEAHMLLQKIYRDVVRKAVFAKSEKFLQAKLAFIRAGEDTASPEFTAFRNEKLALDELVNFSALPLSKALERQFASTPLLMPSSDTPLRLREMLLAEVERFIAWHEDRRGSLEKDAALQRLFAQYDDIFALGVRCVPPSNSSGMEKIGYSGGHGVVAGDQSDLFGSLVFNSAYACGFENDVEIEKGNWNGFNDIFSELTELNTLPFAVASYPAFSVVSAKESTRHPEYPFKQDSVGHVERIWRTLKIFGDVAINMAYGAGTFSRFKVWGPVQVRGNVVASGIGNSAVPDYPVENALVIASDRKAPLITDIYGHYEDQFMLLPAFSWRRSRHYDAFLFDENGEVMFAKDYAPAAQSIYASKTMSFNNSPVTHILYRATPVAILNRVNPQTLRSFSSFQFIRPDGLTEFNSFNRQYGNDGFVDFLPPDEYFYLVLKDGAAGNELVAEPRAFCLGTRRGVGSAHSTISREIDGQGYLAADTPVLRNISAEAAASMDWLADRRLAIQKRFGMADDMTLAFSHKAKTLAEEAARAPLGTPYLERADDSGDALAYQILNHPVIRESVAEAVTGILWYLGLLVPFVFFFEKLVFGFTDLRKRLLAEGVIFLVVFCLLRILHPAFHMVRSPVVILLGFIIIIVVGSVTVVLAGKFQENLDAVRRARGVVKGASASTYGIVMTSFMLGLNNMHKRKVRTWLTCATLVLMTFVMICFTSTQSNTIETETAVGVARYQGIVVRKKLFKPLSGTEIAALKGSFSNHSVSRRGFFCSFYNHVTQTAEQPFFQIVSGEGGDARTATVNAALGFDCTEPLANDIRFLSTNGWFTVEQQSLLEPPYPVMLPEVVARQLGITVDMVNNHEAEVAICGVKYYVQNIYDSALFDSLTDIDGRHLLPFNGMAINNPKIYGWCEIIAEDSDPVISSSQLVFVMNGQLNNDSRGIRTVSAVIDMGNVAVPQARSEISVYMEKTGEECHYATGGTAFVGQRSRTRGVSGVADILIPLIIAGLTVLNTMKGSVYERQGEIAVYNAVGIAPKYIFFMFIAESLVYSVVGTVAGYILSQGVGRILMATGLTGGLNVNFTSHICIYASLAIAAATLVSTWFPARAAMRIAKPSDASRWSLPPPGDDGTIRILLPFTFNKFDRIAVLAFFYNFFDSFGEGSAGAFFSAPPELTIADRLDALADNAYIPELNVRVWLKPFDSGVSQNVEIQLATDYEAKEFTAEMSLMRLTGTRDGWLRLNTAFVRAVRRQFLHWRAVPDGEKKSLFIQARKLLESSLLSNGRRFNG